MGRFDARKIELHASHKRFRSQRVHLEAGHCGLVPEDRKRHGIVPIMSGWAKHHLVRFRSNTSWFGEINEDQESPRY